MSPRQATQIINIVRDEAAAGKKYFDGDVSTDILVNGRVGFVEVPLELFDKYLGTAIWFYRKSPRRFPACNWYGRIVPACFRGRRDLIRT